MSSGFRNVFERLAYTETQSSAQKKSRFRNEFPSPSPSVQSTTRSAPGGFSYTYEGRSTISRDVESDRYSSGVMNGRASTPGHTPSPRKTTNSFFARLAATETFASAMMKGLISQEELELRSPRRERDLSNGRSVRSESSAKSARSMRSTRSVRTAGYTSSSFFDRISNSPTASSALKKANIKDHSPRYGTSSPSLAADSKGHRSTYERLPRSETSTKRIQKAPMSTSTNTVSTTTQRSYSSPYAQSTRSSYNSPHTNRPSSAHASASPRYSPTISPRERPISAIGRPRSAAKSSPKPPLSSSNASDAVQDIPKSTQLSRTTSSKSSKSPKASDHVISPMVKLEKKHDAVKADHIPRETLVFESDDELSFGDESEASTHNNMKHKPQDLGIDDDQPQDFGKDNDQSEMSGLNKEMVTVSITNEKEEDDEEFRADDDSFDEIGDILADTYDQEEVVQKIDSDDRSVHETSEQDEAYEVHESSHNEEPAQSDSHSEEDHEKVVEVTEEAPVPVEAAPATEEFSDDGLSVGSGSSDASKDNFAAPIEIKGRKNSDETSNHEEDNTHFDQNKIDSINIHTVYTPVSDKIDTLDSMPADTSMDGDEEAYDEHSYITDDKVEFDEEKYEAETEEATDMPTFRLLKSEKYHPEYGFEDQDTNELFLTETLLAWEQGEISNHEIAVLIIEAFFERDFENGEHWEVDAGTARELEEDEGGGADLEGRAFVVKRQARLDWNDLYSVAAAKGTIIIYPEKKEVRLENYSYFVAG